MPTAALELKTAHTSSFYYRCNKCSSHIARGRWALLPSLFVPNSFVSPFRRLCSGAIWLGLTLMRRINSVTRDYSCVFSFHVVLYLQKKTKNKTFLLCWPTATVRLFECATVRFCNSPKGGGGRKRSFLARLSMGHFSCVTNNHLKLKTKTTKNAAPIAATLRPSVVVM